jgi:hypothetical protein
VPSIHIRICHRPVYPVNLESFRKAHFFGAIERRWIIRVAFREEGSAAGMADVVLQPEREAGVLDLAGWAPRLFVVEKLNGPSKDTRMHVVRSSSGAGGGGRRRTGA